MKAWDYDQPARRAGDAPRPSSVRALLSSFLGLALRGRAEPKITASETPRTAAPSFQGSLSQRLAAADAARGMRYTPPGRTRSEWSDDAIAAIRERVRNQKVEAGGEGGRPILPESEGRSYELQELLRPGHPEAGAESRWYKSDLVALRAFNTARALLSDPEMGLGLAVMRHDCLVYEWTEVPGSDWRNFDASPHSRRECQNEHHDPDVFDRLGRLYDRYCALGYREGGTCSRLCANTCPGAHGDLLAAMMRAEAAELSGVGDDESPLPSAGPGGRGVAMPVPRTRKKGNRRRFGSGSTARPKTSRP